jgi:hypothetical protein
VKVVRAVLRGRETSNGLLLPDPENERRPHIPEWAEKERLSDLAWILENLHVFWPAAQLGYEEWGRGAITIDTTARPVPGKGNPMWYLSQDLVNERFTEDEQRMVREYQPESEFVTILLKKLGRVSSYRVGVPSVNPEERSSR